MYRQEFYELSSQVTRRLSAYAYSSCWFHRVSAFTQHFDRSNYSRIRFIKLPSDFRTITIYSKCELSKIVASNAETIAILGEFFRNNTDTGNFSHEDNVRYF